MAWQFITIISVWRELSMCREQDALNPAKNPVKGERFSPDCKDETEALCFIKDGRKQ